MHCSLAEKEREARAGGLLDAETVDCINGSTAVLWMPRTGAVGQLQVCNMYCVKRPEHAFWVQCAATALGNRAGSGLCSAMSDRQRMDLLPRRMTKQ